MTELCRNDRVALIDDDNQKPGVLLGDYVKVSADTLPGMNRMEGFRIVKEVCGVCAAAIASVKYDEGLGG
jgi:hypothetical protein